MDIVIIAQYMGNLTDLANSTSRFVYLANMLHERGHDIEFITSTFIHREKTQHAYIPQEYEGCKITALCEPGYNNNVCLGRFYSHHILANNIKKYLNTREKPDVVYVTVPSLAVAEIAAKYCKRNNIKLITDIQDLWPEAFRLIFSMPLVSDIVFMPWEKQANMIYRSANAIIAVSQTYMNRALAIATPQYAEVVYLGKDKLLFDKYAQHHGINNKKIKLAYIGTLGYSYDLTLVFDAMRILPADDLRNIEFYIMGDGPLERQLKDESKDLPVIFTGGLPYPKMVEVLSQCDIAMNPIKKKAAQSIINKHMDYAMAGLPVINTQENEEYRKLLAQYDAGINCECGNAKDCANAIHTLINDKDLRKRMGRNSRRLGEERFDRQETYKHIISIIEKLANNN